MAKPLTAGEKIARDLCEMDAPIDNIIEVDPVDVARRIDEVVNAHNRLECYSTGITNDIIESLRSVAEKSLAELSALKTENATAWAQAHRLALELECLLRDTKDNAIVSRWWDPGTAALSEYQQLKPGAKEDAEVWAKMRKEML